MNPKARIKALDDLERSKGWQLVKATMEREIVQAAMALATNPTMTEKEIDFRRGAIWAAQQLIDLPARIRLLAATDVAMSQDDNADDG